MTSPVPAEITGFVTSPLLNVRPAGGGRLMLQALDLDVTAVHGQQVPADGELAAELLRRLRAVVRNTEDARIESIVVGHRVMPADGLSIVGPTQECPWLYAVATHSGVTLAPFLGEPSPPRCSGPRSRSCRTSGRADSPAVPTLLVRRRHLAVPASSDSRFAGESTIEEDRVAGPETDCCRARADHPPSAHPDR